MNKEIETTESTTNNMNTAESNELKNIKYKTMLATGITWPERKSSSNLCVLDKFLENEKNSNSSEPWCKLDKTTKI